MLATTVSYLSLLETKRHNVVSEKQQDSQIAINQQVANIQAGQLEETKRHNVATENFQWANLSETIRHNQVTEGINLFDANTKRMNIDISRFNAETQRYAAVQNAGIGWANVAVNQGQLAVAQTRAANDYEIGKLNASANVSNAQTNVKKQQEEIRYHDMWNDIQTQSNENAATSNVIKSQQLEWDKEIEQKKYELDKVNKYWQNTLDTIDTASSLFHNIVSDVSTVSENVSPSGKYFKKKGKKK